MKYSFSISTELYENNYQGIYSYAYVLAIAIYLLATLGGTT